MGDHCGGLGGDPAAGGGRGLRRDRRITSGPGLGVVYTVRAEVQPGQMGAVDFKAQSHTASAQWKTLVALWGEN